MGLGVTDLSASFLTRSSCPITTDQFSFNQHKFLKGGTQKATEDLMLATLKESISLPGRMICLLHPWQDPVPFRRVWW